MASTTPTQTPARHRVRSKSPRSRPTTPLRASSRSSLRESSQRARAASTSGNALHGLQDGFAELGDAMADLEQNFVQLQLMHESLARFSESFAAFLYGMNMNAFCVDFPEAPIADSFKRPQNYASLSNPHSHRSDGLDDINATFLTTDTSFVDNPPTSKTASQYHTPPTPAPASEPTGPSRGRGSIPTRATRARGIPVRGGTTRGTRGASGIPARGGPGQSRYAKT